MARSAQTSQHSFSMIPRAEIPRSSFDRSHGHKTTFDSGYLVPIYHDEVLPGDTFSVGMTGFVRLATPLNPFFDNLRMSTFWFFVPNRLIWDNWQKMNGEQRNPTDSTDYMAPIITLGLTDYANTIYDYLGMPAKLVNAVDVSAFLLRAYNLIWNEWFRDENLQTSVSTLTDDGPDPASSYALLRRGKRHDYFTSSLPWPQKGDSVSIPLGAMAPVVPGGVGANTPLFNVGGVTAAGLSSTAASANANFNKTITSAGTAVWNVSGLEADLSQATAATINQLRQAFQVQRLYERDARGGTRYTEIVRSHFGVVSPDARLQRPEYLGGGSSPLNTHAVPQTSSSVDDGTNPPSPQGTMGAYTTGVITGHGFSKSFTEHGVILGLLCVHPVEQIYQQGLQRMHKRRDRFDFYWPALSHIGEQAVLSEEIFCDGTPGDDTVWGYQERYAEYRYKGSYVTGEMRSNFAQSLDSWHLANDFATRPALNASFIQENPPLDRLLAVQTGPQLIGDFFFQERTARPMPTYGVPGMMDHF